LFDTEGSPVENSLFIFIDTVYELRGIMLQPAVLSRPDLSGLILPDKIGIEFAVATAENGSLTFIWKGAARSKEELLGLKLMSTREYYDFVLRSNNGVVIRAPLEGDPAFVGMEIQIQDTHYYRKLKDYIGFLGHTGRAYPNNRLVIRPSEKFHR
jgi:hypothetical protein